MKLSKQELKLVGDCILDEIETYTQRDILDDSERYTKLIEVLKKFKVDYERIN